MKPFSPSSTTPFRTLLIIVFLFLSTTTARPSLYLDDPYSSLLPRSYHTIYARYHPDHPILAARRAAYADFILSRRTEPKKIKPHPDHGKTTLQDRLLSQAGTVGSSPTSGLRVSDSMTMEKERGITITGGKKNKRELHRRRRGKYGTLSRRTREKFQRTKPKVNVGTKGHVDHGKTTLTADITRVPTTLGGGGSKTYDQIDAAPEEKERGISITGGKRRRGEEMW